jgi:predicted HicB family RNase H-like nuclease
MPDEYSFPYALRITDEEVHNALLKLAKLDDRSLNYIINVAMKEYADNHSNELEQGKKKK